MFGVARVGPKVEAFDVHMSEPDRAVMVVVFRARMPHAGERLAGRPIEWKEKRSRVFLIVMPAKLLLAVDPERDLMVGQGDDLATSGFEIGGVGAFCGGEDKATRQKSGDAD